jgi:hypothetical protein
MQKTLKTILISVIASILILSACKIVNAGYVKVDLLEYVDGVRDPFYDEIYSKNNLSISLAYNNDSNLLFFNYTSQINQIQIDSLLLNSSCEGKSYKIIFSQVKPGNITYYFIEIWLDRTNVISIDDEYYIQINAESPFRITVTITLPESPEPGITGPEPNYNWLSIVFFILSVVTIRLFMLFKKPYMYFRLANEYNCVCVGRYVDSTYDENLKKWLHIFKGSGEIREIYSNLSYNDLENFALNVKNFLIGKISGFHQLLPHVILKTIQVPGNVIIKKKAVDPRQKRLKYLYDFFIFLPMKGFVYSLYQQVFKKTDENLTEIEYLELEYSQESLEFKFNANYKTSELNKEGISTWVEKSETDVEYSKILALEKSSIQDLKFSFSKATIRKFNSIREALQNRDSNDQLKSKYIVKELELSSQNRKLSDENFDFYQQLRDMKDNFSSKLVEALKRFTQKSESLNSALPEVLGEVFYGKKLGMSDEENYSKALSKINARESNLTKDTKSFEIFEQNKQLIEKVNQLEKKFDANKLIGGELD